MRKNVRPESGALLAVLAVVICSALAQVVWQAFVRVEDADDQARSALSTALDLEQKVSELEDAIDELRSEIDRQR
jgi:peptidoglycan hydrolase CwlO-like protein